MSSENVAFELEQSQGISLRRIEQRVKYTDFVDGGSTDGTMTLSTKLPAYSIPIASKVKIITGFTGSTNSTAVLKIGTSTTALAAGVVDADILTTDTTVNVFTASKTYISLATFSDGDVPQDDAQTVASNYILLTITMGGGVADWTAVTAGDMIVTIYYFNTEVDGGSSITVL